MTAMNIDLLLASRAVPWNIVKRPKLPALLAA
jgi:hypothetical protein